MTRVFRSSLCLFAALAAVALPTFAADLASSVSELEGAIQARLAVIGSAPADRAGTKEVKLLDRAAETLSAYAGRNDTADLQVVTKAEKFVAKSRTDDDVILDAAGDALRSLGRTVEAEAAPTADLAATLSVEKYRTKVNALLAKATTLLESGRDEIDVSPVGAQKRIWKARSRYRKAAARLAKYLAKGAGPLPPGMTVLEGPVRIENRSRDPYYLVDINVSGDFRNDVTHYVTLTVKGYSMEATDLASLPAEIRPGPGPSPVPQVLPLTTYLEEYRWRMTPVENYTIEPHTFEGTLVLHFAKHRTPGKRDPIWKVTIER